MPKRCCVPNCYSNSVSKSQEKVQHITTFSFPKNEERKSEWVRAVKRDNFVPTKYSFVCIKHFRESDILKNLRSNGREVGSLRTVPKLCESAVPCIFPDWPQYYQKPAIKERKDPNIRHQNVQIRTETLTNTFLNEDKITYTGEFFKDKDNGKKLNLSYYFIFQVNFLKIIVRS